MILELHIELQRVKPVVWRDIHIHHHATFEDLHHVIQLIFDWWDAYDYRFVVKDNNQHIAILNDEEASLKSNKRKCIVQRASEIKLDQYFTRNGKTIEYIYGANNCYEVYITFNQLHSPISNEQAYPIVVAAGNELLHSDGNEQEAVQFPFGKQQALQHKNLVNRLNKKLTYNLLRFSRNDYEIYLNDCWNDLFEATKRYYEHKPWNDISNQQVFAIYDESYDEYLFCSILGNNSDLYGLSVYIGFNGLLSLHTSLTKNLSIEQLFQIHSNLLLRFEQNNKNEALIERANKQPLVINDNIVAQFTSYRPGYFPWEIDEKEASMFILAIEETLRILEKIKSGLLLPNYIKEDCLLLLTRNNKNKVVESFITFDQMIKRILPLQLTLSDMEIKRLNNMSRSNDETVEFSLQYINVPIQRLKGNRPFLPLSSVIANQHTKHIIYHNVYDDRLNYKIVQAEFIHMINLLGYLPSLILTDDLTYHYLKPLLLQVDLPVRIEHDLPVTENVNATISQYLLSKVN